MHRSDEISIPWVLLPPLRKTVGALTIGWATRRARSSKHDAAIRGAGPCMLHAREPLWATLLSWRPSYGIRTREGGTVSGWSERRRLRVRRISARSGIPFSEP